MKDHHKASECLSLLEGRTDNTTWEDDDLKTLLLHNLSVGFLNVPPPNRVCLLLGKLLKDVSVSMQSLTVRIFDSSIRTFDSCTPEGVPGEIPWGVPGDLSGGTPGGIPGAIAGDSSGGVSSVRAPGTPLLGKNITINIVGLCVTVKDFHFESYFDVVLHDLVVSEGRLDSNKYVLCSTLTKTPTKTVDMLVINVIKIKDSRSNKFSKFGLIVTTVMQGLLVMADSGVALYFAPYIKILAVAKVYIYLLHYISIALKIKYIIYII